MRAGGTLRRSTPLHRLDTPPSALPHETTSATTLQPVRVRASPMNSAPQRLVQEFVRIRQSREQDREAILLSLLSRSVLVRLPDSVRRGPSLRAELVGWGVRERR